MTNSCPECGSEVDLARRTVPVWSGVCPSCQHSMTLLHSETPSTGGIVGTEAPAASAGPSPDALQLECPDCDGNHAIQSGSAERLTAVCGDCGTSFEFVRSTGAEEEEAPERRPRRPRPEFESSRDGDRPPSRPCRNCGGQLRFSTGPDGLVTGECASCGNRFTLPPRNDRPGGRPQRGGGFRSGFGGRGGGGGGFRNDRRGPPRFRAGGRSEREDDRRPVRRRRRDDDN